MIALENWKPIIGYKSHYLISDQGRVKRISTGKILKPRPLDGYLRVSLWMNNRGNDYRIHRLVMAAFIGPCPKNKEVKHKDGQRSNNILNNLEYVTRSENNHNAFLRNPKSWRGENHNRAKLTQKQIWRIRSLYKSGLYTQEQLGKLFNVSHSTISREVNYRGWG